MSEWRGLGLKSFCAVIYRTHLSCSRYTRDALIKNRIIKITRHFDSISIQHHPAKIDNNNNQWKMYHFSAVHGSHECVRVCVCQWYSTLRDPVIIFLVDFTWKAIRYLIAFSIFQKYSRIYSRNSQKTHIKYFDRFFSPVHTLTLTYICCAHRYHFVVSPAGLMVDAISSHYSLVFIWIKFSIHRRTKYLSEINTMTHSRMQSNKFFFESVSHFFEPILNVLSDCLSLCVVYMIRCYVYSIYTWICIYIYISKLKSFTIDI